jgi:hypothetical protein
MAEERQGLPVKLPLPLYGKLRDAAYQRRESMNAIVIKALEKELDNETH